MRRLLLTLMLGGCLTAPLAMRAAPPPQRYYDRDHRDYHEFNENERRAYRHWLEEERHQRHHEWERAHERERRDYWRWRHEHRDWR